MQLGTIVYLFEDDISLLSREMPQHKLTYHHFRTITMDIVENASVVLFINNKGHKQYLKQRH